MYRLNNSCFAYETQLYMYFVSVCINLKQIPQDFILGAVLRLMAHEVINIVYHAYIGAFGSIVSESAEIQKNVFE